MVTLRPYQARALERLRGEISLGRRRILLVAPTGAGKTTIAGKIISGASNKGNRCIFLAHRKELIEQCSDRLDEMGVSHGIIKSGNKRKNPEAMVQVASIQTLKNRDHWDAEIVFIDECHRSASPMYVSVLSRYPENVVIGLTATPFRMDGKGLGEISLDCTGGEPFTLYESLVEVASVQELVDLGFLVMPTTYGAPEIDMTGVKVTAGDYDKKQTAKAMEGTILRGDLLKNWAKKCGEATGAEVVFENEKLKHTDCNACTVVFAPSIRQSHMIVEQFKAAGVSAAHLDGKTSDAERTKILKDLRNRNLTVLSNYSICSEGWDLPHLEAVIGARPTRSRSLVKQMIGRLMRPDDDKRFAFLFDHADWTRTHGFVNEPETYSLEGREKRPRKGQSKPPLRECPNCEALCHISTPVCQECGFQFPKREIGYTDEEFVELNSTNINNGRPRAHSVPLQRRQEDFNKWCLRCKENGYKPNWARMRYQQVYGEWPAQQSGIATPRFFWKYQKEYERSERQERGTAH